MVNYGLERDFAHKYAISLTLNRETKFKVAYYKPYSYIPVVFWKDMTIRPRGQGKKKESNSGFQSYDLRLNIWHRSMVQRYCTPFHHKHYCLQYKKDRVKVTDIWFYMIWYLGLIWYLLPKKIVQDHCIHFTCMCQIGERIYMVWARLEQFYLTLALARPRTLVQGRCTSCEVWAVFGQWVRIYALDK